VVGFGAAAGGRGAGGGTALATRSPPMRVVDRLRALYPEAPRHRLKEWLERGRVEVNGQIARDGRRAIGPDDRVRLGRVGEHARVPGAAPFPPALGLLHEDEHPLVIDKPARLLTSATARGRQRTAHRLLSGDI